MLDYIVIIGGPLALVVILVWMLIEMPLLTRVVGG